LPEGFFIHRAPAFSFNCREIASGKPEPATTSCCFSDSGGGGGSSSQRLTAASISGKSLTAARPLAVHRGLHAARTICGRSSILAALPGLALLAPSPGVSAVQRLLPRRLAAGVDHYSWCRTTLPLSRQYVVPAYCLKLLFVLVARLRHYLQACTVLRSRCDLDAACCEPNCALLQ
jgi:hypothetical protein